MSIKYGSDKIIRSSADIGAYGINTVVFDLDGVLVKGGSWPEVFKSIGASKEHSDMLSTYRAGGFQSYMDWTDHACMALKDKGLTKNLFYRVLGRIPLMNGAEYVGKMLNMHGYKTGIITGGFDAMAQRVKQKLEMDFYAACCSLEFGVDERLSSWKLERCDYKDKSEQMYMLAAQHGFDPTNCAYVGDGEGDVDIMKEAKFSIAFNPKTENVKRAAKKVVEGNDLRKILEYFLPIPIC